MREHLQMAKPGHPLLAPFSPTPYEQYIMAVFWQLHRDRPILFNGRGYFTLASMVYYQQLHGDILSTDEVDVLQHLDRVFIDADQEIRSKKNG